MKDNHICGPDSMCDAECMESAYRPSKNQLIAIEMAPVTVDKTEMLVRFNRPFTTAEMNAMHRALNLHLVGASVETTGVREPVLQRIIDRHVRWRKTAIGFLRQVVDGRGSEDEWPALAEFLDRSDSRMVASSPEKRAACDGCGMPATGRCPHCQAVTCGKCAVCEHSPLEPTPPHPGPSIEKAFANSPRRVEPSGRCEACGHHDRYHIDDGNGNVVCRAANDCVCIHRVEWIPPEKATELRDPHLFGTMAAGDCPSCGGKRGEHKHGCSALNGGDEHG